MRQITVASLLIALLLAFSCSKTETQEDNFKPNNPDFSSGVLTPEILWSFGRVGETELSPDGTKVLYALTYYSIEQNKSKRELYVIDLKDNSTTQITNNSYNEYSPVWSNNGEKIFYMAANNSGSMQIWQMNSDGSNPICISDAPNDITGFKFTANNDAVLYTSEVKTDQTLQDKYPDLPNANALEYEELMVRHWDVWEDENYSHVFYAKYSSNPPSITDAEDIMIDEPYDSPMPPFDGMENITFSADGSKIAYTCKKQTDLEFATSTNSEIYVYDVKTKETKNISKGIMGYDKNPVFSNNGDKIAWESMERDGFEADKVRLMVYDFNTAQTTDYSQGFDQDVHSLVWNEDDSKIFFVSGIKATEQIFSFDFGTKEYKQVTTGTHNVNSFILHGDFAIANIMSMSLPTEIFKVDITNGDIAQISFVNKDILDKITFGKVEERWLTTTDGKKMLTWVIYPPNFDPNKKYPALLYCQGGPQSTVSQFFSYRWNFQIMAANDYIIVAPNRRGLPSFGQEWNDQISKDYGGQNMLDYFVAIDTLAAEPYVDENRLGAVGASYGGFSVFWLAGNHNKRFKTFIAHDGIFNFSSMYGTTEELWFINWDTGGPYWEPTQPNCYNASPHLFVKKWDTPIMIVQGGRDYRVSDGQALEAFTAAKVMGLDARLLYFPEENHWVLHPQNGILWQREFFDWLDKYLK